ncbi:MAG: tripartite tricarboxylate transporter substrate binding protein [Bdellovibrionales bacterium]|nr:tripartite tricarboxylate transporter substrate binding protein [Ramlibacter sp.]
MKNMTFKLRTLLLCSALACGAASAQESAASYPSKPIHILVPFVAGGGADAAARLVAQKLTDKWGVQVVVDNRPGGNTVIATQTAARSAGDGYTLLLINSTFAINTILTPNLPYDAEKDFTPVSAVGATPFLMVVHPSVPAQNFKDMMGILKASRPGEWNFATVGSTGVGRIAGEQFAQQAGVKLQHIPFKGAAEVVSAMVGGDVKFTIDPPSTHIPQIRAGKLRPLAVTGSTRLPSLPDVPTFAEAGMPEYDIRMFFGLLAPSATPKPIVAKLSAAITEMMNLPDVKERMRTLEFVPIGTGSEAFQALLKTENERFARIIKAADIKAGQ